jgi:hypothetical protein
MTTLLTSPEQLVAVEGFLQVLDDLPSEDDRARVLLTGLSRLGIPLQDLELIASYMDDYAEPFEHAVTRWTVGQLRRSLAGLRDDLPIEVNYTEGPGGNTGTQVLVDVGFGHGTRGDGTEELQLSCDFPSAEYYRPRRS